MEDSRLTWRLFFFAVFLALLGAISYAEELTEDKEYVANDAPTEEMGHSHQDSVKRRQDSDGFSFLNYFFNGGNAQQQPNSQLITISGQQQQVQPYQQQQQVQPYQQQQQVQPYQQQQQVQPYQQQQQVQPYQQQGTYQDRTLQLQQQPYYQQQQQQQYQNDQNIVGQGQYDANSRTGSYSGSSGGTIQIGSRPRFWNMITAIPRIMQVLSSGGKVVMGVELGKNFYFGPVGVKPLYS